MEGKLYYSLKAPEQDVRFFALDSTYLDKPQLEWLEKELSGSKERWKIPFFHHPPYSSGGRHGSDLRLRAAVEPLFLQHGVTVVFTGHDHFYQRTRPQQGITYFVAGSAGKLARATCGQLAADGEWLRRRPGLHDRQHPRGSADVSGDATEGDDCRFRGDRAAEWGVTAQSTTALDIC